MSRQIQIRRGTAAENNSFTGAIGEITMDTTNKTLRIHDGETTGGIALAKQSEVSNTLNDKLNKTLDNLPDASKDSLISFGRQFTNVGTIIAQGGSGIAGEYNLGFTDNKVKIGIFECCLETTQAGFSNIALSSDVMTTPTNIAGTNNWYRNDGSIIIPFINKIKISFPSSSAGIGTGTTVKFIGYM